MKKKSILLSITLASLLQAEQITSIEYVNLTKISLPVANETLKLKVGDEIDVESVNKAIKDFYKFNYFEDIKVNIDNGKLQFIFDEKPSIANVDITGYKSREDDINILRKQIGLEKGNMYSEKRIKSAKEKLLKELEREGYINSVVEAEVEHLNEDSVAITFNVNKGDEIIIKKVNYFGSENLEASDFEPATANKEVEFASWFITQNSGELAAEQLEYDSKRIQEVYFENGYLDAKVKDPFLEVDFSSNQAELDFYIEEGRQYNVNDIAIYVNSEIVKAEDIYPELKLRKGRTFNIKRLRKDADYIKTLVADKGYAFAQVKYDIKKDEKNGTADLVYNVIPGEKVYIRDVKISGNTRTLDRVIRRDVYLAPGDLFSLTDFNDSRNKLRRTGYFEDVIIEQKRVTADKMDIVVKVKEAATGNIILGGGYGSYDGFMINGSIVDNNIFGSGLSLGVSVDLSKRKTDLSIRLKNPAIADSKYHGDLDIHSDEIEIDSSKYELNKDVKGFTVGVGKEFIRNLRAGAKYRLDFIKEEYDYEDDAGVPESKRFVDTDYVTSSITPYLNFDNTDDYLNPRSGIRTGSSLEIAGLGGDSEYLKSSSYFKYFYSLNDLYDLDWIFRYKLQANFLVDNGQINQGDSLYLGGTKSLRGFKSYAFPKNESGERVDPYKQMAATSLEMSFPISQQAKMRWGVFYDYGMIGEDNMSDVKRSSTGALFEWISPFGPLQLIFAQPLDDEKGDDTSSFEFSLGSSF
ncbi:outer membrane protein assembly factor BamA [Halarcobacter bivalviorum]|uniref:Outer membrane protein assembly factor BamA n=1 Tax=Halarcobacter bivalviorum TaxID=663364 RepID=A0AAX2AA07_9BACT|nr:outer membrane protein assembly factor BamA [Halarcobacter bivalviorum]AXH12312.1 beta-barrel assembly machinery complex, BamA/YaeT protein [Halarcobacter bivalviorum]RXK10755.1 outer membrane protein assembly factor BamA [Halarcobacter bivalviorum]